jgi:hypothetical protein
LHQIAEPDFGGRLVERDPSVLEHVDPLAGRQHLGVVVADQDDRDLAQFPQPGDDVKDQDPLLDPQRRGRLVEQQDPCLRHDAASQRDHLPLPARQPPHRKVHRGQLHAELGQHATCLRTHPPVGEQWQRPTHQLAT